MHSNDTLAKRPVGRPSLRVTQTCATCGTSFQTKRSDVARGGGRFCSRACYVLNQTGPKGPLADRVWPKVNKQGPIPGHCPERGPCWEWTAALGPKHRYGIVNIAGSSRLAHRVVWELVVGPEDRDLLHHCDNRRCVHADPDPARSHLYPGTDLENSRDAWDRGRAVKPPQPTAEQRLRGNDHWTRKQPGRVLRGAQKPNARPSIDEAPELRARYAAGKATLAELARDYGISPAQASLVSRGLTWHFSNPRDV